MSQQSVGIQRVAVSLFVPVAMTGDPQTPWQAGPYPNNWRTGTKKPLSGSRDGRAAYINPGLDDLLYEGRWYRIPDDPGCAATAAFEVKAFELFRIPTEKPRPSGILVVHGRITDMSEPLRVLDTVVNHNEQHGKPMRIWIQGLLPPNATVYPLHRRAEHISLMTFRSTRMAALPGLSHLSENQLPNAWLAYIATSGRIVPDMDMIGSVGTVVGMSLSLRGLVSKAGIALVGLQADSGRSDGSHGFDYGGAEFFVEGLYSDTMLLAQLQKYKVRELREKLNTARAAGGDADQLASLEQELIAFRVTYWRSDFAPQGSQDDFLKAYQEVNGVVAELDEIHNQIREYSDQVQRHQQELTNAVLGILTVLAFPLGIAMAIWGGITKHTFAQLGVALGIGLFVAVLTLLLPGTRTLLRGVLPRRGDAKR
jgi:uncharacterized protein YukE